MMLCKWENLPEFMQTDEVRPYYNALRRKRLSLFFKRVFDVIASAIMLVLFSPLFLILAIAIKIDSPGPVFFRQERVTQYGRHFRIFKFRSMIQNADKKGSSVTVGGDSRITRVGRFIRKYRLDETSQLIDIFRGTMTFVGTRPEVPKYVERYTPEMLATLLLPAGVTSLASIKFKEEADLIASADDVDSVYVEMILPRKMEYNLSYLNSFSFFWDLKLMVDTVLAVV